MRLGSIEARDSIEESQQIQQIFDNSPQIVYTGVWVQNNFVVPTSNPPINETSHSTAQPGSSMFLSFHGTQINASGTIPAGDGVLSANYIIDDGSSMTIVVNAILQSSDLLYQTLFESPTLDLGLHNLTVQVVETGFGRNYTFQQFNVTTGAAGDGIPSSESEPQDSRVPAIVGGVIGNIVILLAIFIVLHLWQRRKMARKCRHKCTWCETSGAEGDVTHNRDNFSVGINPFIISPPQRTDGRNLNSTYMQPAHSFVGPINPPPYSIGELNTLSVHLAERGSEECSRLAGNKNSQSVKQ